MTTTLLPKFIGAIDSCNRCYFNQIPSKIQLLKIERKLTVE